MNIVFTKKKKQLKWSRFSNIIDKRHIIYKIHNHFTLVSRDIVVQEFLYKRYERKQPIY